VRGQADMTIIDRISVKLGYVAAVLLFLTGVFLTWEVLARYLLNMPTKWASELSEFCLLWGVFLGLGRTIHFRENITIEVAYDRLSPPKQRFVDLLSLTFVLLFFIFVARYGFELAWDSVKRGTTTGTMVDIPSWWEEAAVPVGCTWAAIQTLVEIMRAATGRGWTAMVGHGKDV
jgi:C4-dicarboxylate transporter, DctQ subunit